MLFRSILINGGATSTATTNVDLTIFATAAYTMELSNTSDFASSTWEPYVTSHPWVLTDGAGTKTVYGRFRAVNGADVGSAQASIELTGGKVLGESTSCGTYLNDYIHIGWANNPSEVMKLQAFLNENLGTTLPLTGVYGKADFDAVEQFQVKYNGPVLVPWLPLGLPSPTTPTGFVYQTTRRWINMLHCSLLDLPIPVLHVYQP